MTKIQDSKCIPYIVTAFRLRKGQSRKTICHSRISLVRSGTQWEDKQFETCWIDHGRKISLRNLGVNVDWD